MTTELTTLLLALSWTASLCDVTSSLPQVWKCRHPRTTHNLAVGMILLRLLGAVCWSVWGYYHQAVTILILVGPMVAFFVELILLCCVLRDVLLPLDDSECNDVWLKEAESPYGQDKEPQTLNKNKRVEI